MAFDGIILEVQLNGFVTCVASCASESLFFLSQIWSMLLVFVMGFDRGFIRTRDNVTLQ